MTGDHSHPWTPLLRHGAISIIRHVLGLLTIVASLLLLLSVANLAESIAARLSWHLLATCLRLAAWVLASLTAWYALMHLLRLRRDRSLGLWLLLTATYVVLVWSVGGLPLVPRPSGTSAEPVLAAERPLIVADGISNAALPPLDRAEQLAAATPPLQPTVVPLPTATAVPVARLPRWGTTPERATLWSSPEADAESFGSTVPRSYVRVLGATEERFRVYYGGDRVRQRAGEAWIDKDGFAISDWPQFARTRQSSALRSEPNLRSAMVATVPQGAYVEVLGGGSDEWGRVLYLGDGRDAGPYLGWLHIADVVPSDVDPARIGRFLATAAALARQPDVWLKVPYLSQLDGSPWSAANCGPTVVAMLLEAHGIQARPADVRRHVMAMQGTVNCHDCGVFIEHLASAVDLYGLQASGLRATGGALSKWTIPEIREAVRAGRPVLPQVMYRQLPGREDALYWGDHYIVITGVSGEYFLYNDPIDDGPGYGRLIHAEQLRRAMAASDFPMAAFATTMP